MTAHLTQDEPFRWSGIDVLPHKEDDDAFQSVTRQMLTEEGNTSLVYFEIAPGGHTALERHESTQVIVPIRGAGSVLIGDLVIELELNDILMLPSWSWHQFRASGAEPLGFLCRVTLEGDRPDAPIAADLNLMRSDPAVADFIRP